MPPLVLYCRPDTLRRSLFFTIHSPCQSNEIICQRVTNLDFNSDHDETPPPIRSFTSRTDAISSDSMLFISIWSYAVHPARLHAAFCPRMALNSAETWPFVIGRGGFMGVACVAIEFFLCFWLAERPRTAERCAPPASFDRWRRDDSAKNQSGISESHHTDVFKFEQGVTI